MADNYFYHRTGTYIQFIVRDESGAKVDDLKCKIRDKKATASVMKLLKDKYDFSPVIDPADSVNTKGKEWLGSSKNIFDF